MLIGGEETMVTIGIPGGYNIYNAAAANHRCDSLEAPCRHRRRCCGEL